MLIKTEHHKVCRIARHDKRNKESFRNLLFESPAGQSTFFLRL